MNNKDKYANMLHEQGRHRDAIKTYEEMLKDDSISPIDIYNLAVCYYAVEDFEKSIETYKLAIIHGINGFQSYLGISLCYCSMGRYEEAIKYMDISIKMNPVDERAHRFKFLINEAMNGNSEIFRKKNPRKFSNEYVSKITKKWSINVVNYIHGKGFEVYCYLYDNNNNGTETLIDEIEFVNSNTEDFEKIKNELFKKYNTDKILLI